MLTWQRHRALASRPTLLFALTLVVALVGTVAATTSAFASFSLSGDN